MARETFPVSGSMVVIPTQEPFVVFSLLCPAEEGRDRAALGAAGVQPDGGRCGILSRLGCILTKGGRLSQEVLEEARVLSPHAVCCQLSSSQAQLKQGSEFP